MHHALNETQSTVTEVQPTEQKKIILRQALLIIAARLESSKSLIEISTSNVIFEGNVIAI